MSNLYELTAEFERLLEVEEFDAEALDELDLLNGEVESKANQIALYILNLKGEAELVHERVKEMLDRRARLLKKVEQLQTYLLTNLEKVGKVHIHSSPDVEIKIKKNPPKVVIEDEAGLPDDWFDVTTVRRLSKARLKEALLSNEVVDGAHVVQSHRIEIK